LGEPAASTRPVALAGAAPHYTPPRLDGGRPGTFWFNTQRPTAGTGWDIDAVAFHEAVPGHHLQLSRLQRLDGLPALQRQRSLSVFSEGWGLYAEQLAEETGLYTDDRGRLGAVSAALMRAVRLVVDTGLHAKRWSRDEAIAFMTANTSMAARDIAVEIDRYIADPGQATAYKVGELKLKALRARAQAALGPRFDVRDFHDQVLMTGAMPLAILEAKIDAWIAAGGPAYA